MKCFWFVFILLTSNKVIGQKKDGCSCFETYSTKYPKQAQDKKIGGTVIIEFDQDSTCVLSNPKVIKGLGYGCDEEALRLAKQKVNNSTKCSLKCPGEKCSIEKVRWSIIFQYYPE